MCAKRGRIPTVQSHLIDDEIKNFKDKILQVININEENGKCKYNIGMK